MARPSVLTYLSPGKLIDTFKGFVDTFNYLVDFVENLRGDGDSDKEKSITIDRSVPDHPIIKCSATGSGGTPPDEKSIWERDNKLEIYAFYDAGIDEVPVKDASGVIVWKPYAEAGVVETTFEGTDGSTAKGQYVKFVPDHDTNLTVHVDKNAAGVVTISIGLRWMNV